MICTLLSGLAMIALEPTLLKGSGWLHAKILIVVLLVAYHFNLYRYMIALREDRDMHTGRFFRILNEFPSIALIIITILVVLKPF